MRNRVWRPAWSIPHFSVGVAWACGSGQRSLRTYCTSYVCRHNASRSPRSRLRAAFLVCAGFALLAALLSVSMLRLAPQERNAESVTTH